MLTVCPNCRHQFPAPSSCCAEVNNGPNRQETEAVNAVHPATCYFGGLLVPRGYTSGGSCYINAPPIVHEPVVYQSNVAHSCSSTGIANSESIDSELLIFSHNDGQPLPEQTHRSCSRMRALPSNNTTPFIVTTNVKHDVITSQRNVVTTCELTGGSVRIATPGIQSGGCVIQSTDAGILVQAPHIEIQPKFTGGGCLVQERMLSADNEQLTISNNYVEDITRFGNTHRMPVVLPSSCSELPGGREILASRTAVENSEISNIELKQPRILDAVKTNSCCGCSGSIQNACEHHEQSANADNQGSLLLEHLNNGMQIQLNATVQLPASLGQCMVNITATTTTPSNQAATTQSGARTRNNFNGGGIIQLKDSAMGNRIVAGNAYNNNEPTDGEPTTPISLLMPYADPWSLKIPYLMPKTVNKLHDVKRLLQICGWYHEGISWQQSESLLKNAPIGQWLMRDSSDSRYSFAVSVQTARGPTSIRVDSFLQSFRFDADPALILAMPLFECPISMLEYYVEYSKRMDGHRKEVWVDYSGQLYSQIYLTKPLIKEVSSLSHLARLAVNRNKLPVDHLPLLIRNYLAEYPYTF